MHLTPELSIIIPVLNEEKIIDKLLQYLEAVCPNSNKIEILVVDGGSNDNTVSIARKSNTKLFFSEKGRAKQLNTGAKNAKGDVLYFLHADTYPPKNYHTQIKLAFNQGFESGCFRMQFDSKNLFLRFFGFLTRFNFLICRGGDQSLFVSKGLFEKTGGFNEEYVIYEDVELISRLYKQSRFKILPHTVITSARKYRKKGWLKLQYHFGIIHLKNFMGEGPEALLKYYRQNVLE